MPQRISIHRTIALVAALSKLHNFCIDASIDVGELDPLSSSQPEDIVNLRSRSSEVDSTVVELDITEDGYEVPTGLLEGGHHNDDFPLSLVRRHYRRSDLPDVLPRERLCAHVAQTGMVRPQARRANK